MSTINDNKEIQQEWEEFLPGAWCVKDLLTRNECNDLVESAEAADILSKTPSGDLRHRQRVQVSVPIKKELTNKVWRERILPNIPKEIVITEEDVKKKEQDQKVTYFLHPADCIGRWRPSRMEENWNVAYCAGKGHLAAHRDGDKVLSEHERSFLTVNGYLTDRPLGFGGATRFLKDDIVVSNNKEGDDEIFNIHESDILHRVEADKAGKAVVFFHNLMHDGEPLKDDSPPKWIFRSLIYYKRDPDSAPRQTPAQKEARQLVKAAEKAEEAGLIGDAVKLYKRAYRLDPSLDT